MGKRKHKKKTPKLPPLSLLDKATYGFLSILCLISQMFLYLFVDLVRQDIAFSVENTLAFDDGCLNAWLVLPFAAYIALSGAIALTCKYSECKPIFGKKGIQYGPPKYIEVYPLFSKERKKRPIEEQRPSRVRMRKMGWRIWLAVLVLLLCLVPFGFFARKTVDTDGNFYVYNAFGTMSERYDTEDIAKTEIECNRRYRLRGRRSWAYRITITMKDGTEFTLNNYRFRGDSGNLEYSRLENMLYLKSLVDEDRIEYSGSKWLQRIIERKNLNEEESDLLYELFGIDR